MEVYSFKMPQLSAHIRTVQSVEGLKKNIPCFVIADVARALGYVSKKGDARTDMLLSLMSKEEKIKIH